MSTTGGKRSGGGTSRRSPGQVPRYIMLHCMDGGSLAIIFVRFLCILKVGGLWRLLGGELRQSLVTVLCERKSTVIKSVARKKENLYGLINKSQRFVGLSKYDYIRKMLNKNHLGKVPSKAAECWKIKGPNNTTGYQVNICVTRFSSLRWIVS